ncbi:hypothetical protein GCM10009735_79210 [Actinomadura chokoriensis]
MELQNPRRAVVVAGVGNRRLAHTCHRYHGSLLPNQILAEDGRGGVEWCPRGLLDAELLCVADAGPTGRRAGGRGSGRGLEGLAADVVGTAIRMLSGRAGAGRPFGHS